MPIHVHSWLRTALWFLPLGWLWFRLFDQLRIEWAVNPAYSYGWAVPVLCLYLLWQRGKRDHQATDHGTTGPQGAKITRPQERQTTNHGTGGHVVSPAVSGPVVLLSLVLAFLYAPTRLIQEANPEWRFISWALAFIVIGLTLLCVRLNESTLQRFNLSTAALIFPLAFFLVAVPWPTLVEGRLIQWLTGVNVTVTIELLGLFGIPAVQHGSIIEISTGVVGVDEACSGIRSFQATLMLSLFFGEFYSLTTVRRVLLCLFGFASSLVFNVGRTFILTYVASKQGVPALEKWHDPAGVTVLVWCFVAIWFVSLVIKPPEEERGTRRKGRGARSEGQGAKGEARDTRPLAPFQSADKSAQSKAMAGAEQGSALECGDSSPLSSPGDSSPASGLQPSNFSLQPSAFGFPRVAFGLIAWLVLVEVGVEWWYRAHENNMPVTTAWGAAFPTNNPAFRELPFTGQTRQFLRYDEGHNGTWQEDDGTRWQGIYLRWKPGKIAVHLAKSHTPEVCLSAAGRKMVAKSDLQVFEANGLKLPFFSYVFEGPRDRVHVFYCLWEDRAAEQEFNTEMLTYGNRLAPVLAGRRNSGQRTLELAVWGFETQEQAAAAVQQQLEKIVRVQR